MIVDFAVFLLKTYKVCLKQGTHMVGHGGCCKSQMLCNFVAVGIMGVDVSHDFKPALVA